MSEPNLDSEAVCPACRARQNWSAECRRCKADLTWLWSAVQARTAARNACLAELAAGRPAAAAQAAEQGWQLDPSPQAGRRLAVCRLLAGDWRGARQAARWALEHSAPGAQTAYGALNASPGMRSVQSAVGPGNA